MWARALVRPLAVALAALAAVPVLLASVMILAPQRLLTSRTVGWGLKTFGRAYEPRWSRLDFEIRSADLLEDDVSIAFDDFCFAKKDAPAAGCFKSVAARFTVALSPTGVRVTRLASLAVRGESLRIDGTKEAAKTPAKGGFDPLRLPRLLPAALRGLTLGKVSIELPSVELAASSATTKGSLRLIFDPALAAPLALDARWKKRGGGAVHRGRVRVVAVSDFFKNGQLTYVDLKGAFAAEGVSADFSVKARQAGADAVALEADASGRRGAVRFRWRGGGVQTPESYALAGSFAVDASSGPLRSLRLEPFRLTAARKNGAALPESLRLEATLRAEPAGLRPVRGFTPPRFVEGRLVLNARAAPAPHQADRFDADLSLRLRPYLSWYEGRADLAATASGRLGELPLVRIRQRIDADVSVPRFKDLVDLLADGPYAVPAPLDALAGGLRAALRERGDPRTGRIEFDYTARADLAGQKQKLKLRVSGTGAASRLAAPGRPIEAKTTVTLEDVALQLPHLDPLKLPKVTLDARIKTARSKAADRAAQEDPREARASTSTVALELSVATARPLVLYSDLAKTPVPVALDLRFESPSGLMSGAVEVKSFDVEFFRRKASVDHLTLTFRPGSKQVGLDGLIKYKADEALIDIRLLGTVDKPQVTFESNPPLGQSDIVAMLVFGKSPDELDADQTATVSNTQTAMSDEAFGLASLYLFASTPIQFVGYDSAAKAYTMKLRIPGGETLELDSDFDTTKSVQLRRRLSQHFAIVTEAVDSQTQGNGVITMLEWFARY